MQSDSLFLYFDPFRIYPVYSGPHTSLCSTYFKPCTHIHTHAPEYVSFSQLIAAAVGDGLSMHVCVSHLVLGRYLLTELKKDL